MFTIGLRWAAGRLLRRQPLAILAFWLLVVVATALVECRLEPLQAAERVLFGAVSGMTIPLIVYAATAQVLRIPRGEGRTGLTGVGAAAPSAEAARYGGDRRCWLLGAMVGTGILLAIACALLAGAALLASGGSPGISLAKDLAATVLISGLGGAAYVSFFVFGSTVGKRGWFRPFLLLIDWLLGGFVTAAAFPFPRGHVRALLGAEPLMGLSQSTTWVVLWGLVIAYTLLAILRTPR